MSDHPQWEADVTLSLPFLERLIADQFPALRPVRVEHLADGWDNRVVLVNGAAVFRFPRREEGGDCMAIETQVLPALQGRLPLAIPQLTWIGAPTADYPYVFAGYPLLPGQPPYTVPIGLDARDASAIPLAEFLLALHRVPPAVAEECGAPLDLIGRMDRENRVARFESALEDALARGLLPALDPFDDLLASLPPGDQWTGQTTLVHGDLNFRNVLVGPDGALSGVLDWGDVHRGHRAVDLSFVASFFPPRARDPFFARYGSVDGATWTLARFQAAYQSLHLLAYAHDIGDRAQALEARQALTLSLQP